MRKINLIVIHCSATKVNIDFPIEKVDAAHRAKGWGVTVGGKRVSIGYHWYITKDGVIHQGRPESLVGAHVSGYNANSIGICYEGGLDVNGKAADTRTAAQKEALKKIVGECKKRYPTAKVVGHRDLSPDRNKDGKITPNEWVKMCPCFNVKEEYS